MADEKPDDLERFEKYGEIIDALQEWSYEEGWNLDYKETWFNEEEMLIRAETQLVRGEETDLTYTDDGRQLQLSFYPKDSSLNYDNVTEDTMADESLVYGLVFDAADSSWNNYTGYLKEPQSKEEDIVAEVEIPDDFEAEELRDTLYAISSRSRETTTS